MATCIARGYCSHSFVLPSVSVKRKVTVPLGAGAVQVQAYGGALSATRAQVRDSDIVALSQVDGKEPLGIVALSYRMCHQFYSTIVTGFAANRSDHGYDKVESTGEVGIVAPGTRRTKRDQRYMEE